MQIDGLLGRMAKGNLSKGYSRLMQAGFAKLGCESSRVSIAAYHLGLCSVDWRAGDPFYQSALSLLNRMLTGPRHRMGCMLMIAKPVGQINCCRGAAKQGLVAFYLGHEIFNAGIVMIIMIIMIIIIE
jgi:hypothetical protein